MAQVSLRINGYSYSVGCEDGQEEHLQAMAADIEERIARVKRLGSQSGESRLLVLAALLMADELHDLGSELGRLRAAKQLPPDPAVVRRLAHLADQAEGIAASLGEA